MYTVLWIEDEPEKQDGFPEAAYLEDIDLKHFNTSKSGMDELVRNPEKYDAIILDAKGYDESTDEKARLTGLMNSIKTIHSLPRKIPYFIFSAYLDKKENESAREMLDDEVIYTKAKDNDKLFTDLKASADKQPETQIRHEYSKVFEAVTDYNPETTKTLLNILLAVKQGGSDFSDKEQFTQLRIILEEMFRKANEIGLLHDKCIKNGKVKLTEASLFLSGLATKHVGVKCSKAHFPKIIADNIKNLLFITGDASHTTEVDPSENINIQAYRELINTPYLLFSLVFQLIDVLVWFDHYRKDNSDTETNKSLWEEINHSHSETDWISGIVSNIAGNGYGTFKPDDGTPTVSIIPKMVEENNFTVNDAITVTTKDSPCKTKVFIDQIEKL